MINKVLSILAEISRAPGQLTGGLKRTPDRGQQNRVSTESSGCQSLTPSQSGIKKKKDQRKAGLVSERQSVFQTVWISALFLGKKRQVN